MNERTEEWTDRLFKRQTESPVKRLPFVILFLDFSTIQARNTIAVIPESWQRLGRKICTEMRHRCAKAVTSVRRLEEVIRT